MTTAAHAPIAIDELRRRRAGAAFGHTIHYFDSIDSTSTEADRLARQGAAEGTVVVAEAQSRGRGRLGRTWTSPAHRNLYLSLILRPPIATEEAPLLTLVCGCAAATTVGHWVPQALIKWPNDILIDNRKVCGILTEMHAETAAVSFVVVGIGLNVNMQADDFPEDLRSHATSLLIATGAAVNRTEVAHRLLDQLEALYVIFVRDGFAAIRPQWEKLSALSGRRVAIDIGSRRITGSVIGLADDGTLRVRGENGVEERVVAGDVTVVNGYAAGG